MRVSDIVALHSPFNAAVSRATKTEVISRRRSWANRRRVTDVTMLQGDLSEAWREGNTNYATVAVNFALRDSIIERASGRTVEGGELSRVTELWTFMRARGQLAALSHPADLNWGRRIRPPRADESSTVIRQATEATHSNSWLQFLLITLPGRSGRQYGVWRVSSQ